ncbi:amino acid ABC transporter permease [Salmonella enterica subsp. enterica serovar Virchow]|nr:amino acid ABC transporter permease [Salmonella enterica subsp. enterica]EBU8131942.1 amino acid ABC transporter permease [Salmonella enterica subsp. enterica serovar Java]EBV3599966.1 amino acid ABC transporter permease [Salmonella enterica subsp. enterica serovar Virchow]EFG9152671.1 amino acid ABC transporter permease [Escherichia coli]
MDIELMKRVLPFFMEAAVTTIQISALALALGLTMGALAAFAKMSGVAPVRWLANAYVSVFRGTPCLIQLFLLYFGGPQVGINLEPFAAGVIGLGLNIGAYMAESIRGAILSVDRGQTEASRTIGFSRAETMRYVVLPQAARLMIRPLGVNTIALIKGSALVSAISVIELTYTAQRFISSTYRPFEIFAIAAVFYMAIIYVVARIVDMLDRRFAIV